MKYSMAILSLFALGDISFAADTIVKVNGKCPSGYRDGPGQYCYSSSAAPNGKVIEKVDGKCPGGYRDGTGQYCYGSSTSTGNVIVKVDGKCPSGYRDGPGKYCYQ